MLWIFAFQAKASGPVVNTHVADSMEQLLKTDLDDSTRLIIMLLQVKELAPRDPATALEKAKKALIFSEQIKDYYVKAKLLINIGAIHQIRADYPRALTYYFMALRYGEANNMPVVQSLALNNIAVCYISLGRYEVAEKYLKRNLVVEVKHKLFASLGGTYTNLGGISSRLGKVHETIAYSKKAIEADARYRLPTSTPFLNLADAYNTLKQYDKAEQNFKHALQLELSNGDMHRLSECYVGLGKFYLERNKFDKAAENLFQALHIVENSGITIAAPDIYELISKMYIKQNDFAKAYRYSEKFHAAKDSMLNEKVAAQLNEMQVKYESEKKDKAIQLLNQNTEIAEAKARTQRFYSNFLIAAVVFVLIMSVVLWRNMVLKQKVNSILEKTNGQLSEKNQLLSTQNTQIEWQRQEIAEANQKLELFNKELKEENIVARYEILKSKTNPHFLFNSMSTLSAIVVDDQQLALEFIDRFSQLYRKILETGDLELITLEEELSIVKNYLYLQQMKFGDNMHIDIQIDALYLQYSLPPFALQMVVENAFKHNMISSVHHLTITMLVQDEMLVVKNNLQQRLSKLHSTGTGQKNIIGRYKLLSDVSPRFVMTEKEYIVTLPLLNRTRQYQKTKQV